VVGSLGCIQNAPGPRALVKVTLAPAVEILVDLQTDSVFGNPRAPSGVIDPVKIRYTVLGKAELFPDRGCSREFLAIQLRCETLRLSPGLLGCHLLSEIRYGACTLAVLVQRE
jgi:hypothetical protein